MRTRILSALGLLWAICSASLFAAPTITVQPSGGSVTSGWTSATLSVTATGTGALSYQWKKDGVALANTTAGTAVSRTLPDGRVIETIISGATGATLTITNWAPANAGSYTVTVTDSADAANPVTSNAAVVNVTDTAPTLVNQSPATAAVSEGGRAKLFFNVNGSRPLTIQWFKDGVALPGVNGSSANVYDIDSFSAAKAGTYTATVSNAYGSVTLQPMALTLATAKDPLDIWRWTNPRPQGNNLITVASGGGRVLLVGRGGSIISTTDGQSGNIATSGNGFSLGTAVYDTQSSAYIAAGGFSTIMRSTDATTWTAKGLTGVDEGYNGSASDGAGRIILAGADFNFRPTRGLVRLSADGGNTWTLPSQTPAAWAGVTNIQLTSATYGNGKFVVASSTGALFSSADNGNTWTQATITGGSGVLQAVSYGNGKFVAVGSGGLILTSTDGLNFAAVTSGVTATLFGVNYLPSCSTWVAVGATGTVRASTDNGATWAAPAGALPTPNTDFYSVAENANLTVITGQYGRIFLRPVSTTFDLNNWENAGENLQTDVTGFINFADWDNNSNQFIAVGGSGNIHTSNASGDGWQRRVQNPTGGFLTQWVRFNNLLLVSGSAGIVLSSSDNGFNWTANATTATSTQFNSIAVGGGRAVVVGGGGAILTSTNGTAWTAATSGITETLRRVAYANGQFVAVGGADNGSSIRILTSSDGLTWTNRIAGTTGQLWGLDYTNGTWIAVGAASINGGGGFALRSTDNGVTWTRVDVPGMGFLYSVRALGGRLIATGSPSLTSVPNALAVSADVGLTWSLKPVPAAPNVNTLRAVAKSPTGAYVAVGNDATILTSAMLPPAIVSQPASATLALNSFTQLSVNANSPFQLSYQWRFNGTPINGATNSQLLIANFDSSKAGSYDVVVTATRTEDGNVAETSSTTSSAAVLSLGTGTSVTLPDFGFQRAKFWRHSLPGRLTAAPSGKVYATFNNGGFVNAVDGQLVGAVVRLNADGTRDTTFNIGAVLSDAWAVVPLADGRVLVSGVASHENDETGLPLYRVFRFNADGTRDWSFNSPHFNGIIRFMTLQPDGKLLVTPSFGNSINNGGFGNLVRLNTDGSFDSSFNLPSFNATNPIFAQIVVDANGKIVIAGSFGAVNGVARPSIARLNSDGTLDTTFAPTGFSVAGQVRGLALQTQGANAGKILVAGGTLRDTATNTSRPVLRLNTDGTLDTSFTLGAVSEVVGATGVRPRLLNVLPDDRFTVVSDKLVRYSANGTLDSTFPTVQLSTEVFWMDTLSNGSIYVPPEFGTAVNGQTLTGPVRFTAAGAVDTTFTTGRFQTAVYPRDFSVQSDGKILVWGNFDTVNSSARPGFARLNADGSLDTLTLTGIPNLYTLGNASVLSDGRLLAITQTGTYRTNTTAGIARFNTDGSVDSTFSLAAGVDPANLYVLPDNKILAWSLTATNALNSGLSFQRLTADGAVDSGFTGLGTTAFSRVHRDGSNVITEIVLGQFRIVGHYSDGRALAIATTPDGAYAQGSTTLPVTILRLLADGTIDSTFNAPSVNWTTSAAFTTAINDPLRGVSGQWNLRQVVGSPFTGVVPQADGSVIVYGSFTTLGGVAAPGLARLTATGALDTSFSVGSGAEVRNNPGRNAWIQAVATDAAGKIWVSGTFDTFGGRAAPGLARLNADGSVDTAFVSGARYTPFLSAGGKIAFGANGNVYLSSTFSTTNQTPDAITRLVAQAPLAISHQPGNVTVTAGSQINLGVGLAGAGNFTFQWRRNGVAIAGATQGFYQIPNASRTDADRYDVVISDGSTTITSATAIVSVAPTSYPGTVVQDSTFNPNPLTISSRVNHAVQLADGKWLVAGDFTSWESTPRTYLAKLNADYTLDSTFVPPAFNAPINAIAVAADGSIYVGGDFSRVGVHNCPNLARLTSSGALDLSWAPQDNLAGISVTTLATAPGNKLLVARATSLFRRLNANGTLDSTFAITFASFGRINSIVVEPDGAVAIGGSFSLSVNGVTRFGLARVLANGTLDANFGGTTGASNGVASATPTFGTVNYLMRASDGRYLATGSFSSVGGVDRVRAAILNADGSVNTSFVPAIANSTALGGAIQADGKVVLTGLFNAVAGSSTNGVVRLNADGSVATLFTNGGSVQGFVSATGSNTHFVYPQADGSVAVFGNFQGLFAQRRVGMAVIGADDQLTATAPLLYRPAFSNNVDVRADGKVVMFGSVESASGVTTLKQAALFNPDGSVDGSFPVGTGFAPTGLSTFGVYRAVRQSDGGYIASGDFQGYNGTSRARLLRLKPDGTADTAFNPGGAGPNATIVQLLPLSGGRVLLGGFNSMFYNNTAVTGQLLRLNADGSRDTNFTVSLSNNNAVATAFVNGSYEQPDGKVVLAGGFTHYGTSTTTGTAASGLLRLNVDGTLDTSFAIGSGVTPGSVLMVAGLPDGRLVVVGSFTTFNGTAVNRMVILNANGSRDTTFTAPTALNGTIGQVIPQEDGKFLVFGDFVGNALRLNANGSVDTTFSMQGFTGGFGSANRVTIGDDGSLYVAGNPHAVNYTAPVALSRFRAGTVAAPTIGTQPASVAANLGDSFYFSVTPAGTGPHTYQWMRNGVAISGATSSTYRVNSATAADIANYTVVVTNGAGSVTSSVATVDSAPVLLSQPIDRKVVLGGKLLLRFGVSGNNLNYQWTKNGTPVGGNSADYVVDSAQNGDAGTYVCTATNALGNVQSSSATVTVLPVDNVLWQQFTEFSGEQAPSRLFRDGQGRFYLPWSVQDRNPDMAAGVLIGTLARFSETTGALDTTFKLDRRYRRASWMERQADGKLLISVQVGNAATVIRTSDTGAVDTTFTAPFFGRSIRFIKLQSDGKVIVAAVDTNVAGAVATLGVDAPTIYRLNADGSMDSSFTPAVLSTTPTLAQVFGPPEVDANGKIYLAGTFTSVNGTARTNVARLNADGTLDTAFAATLPAGFASSQARAVALQSDGRAIFVGDFRYTARGTANNPIMAIRFNLDGTLDTTFGQPLRNDLGFLGRGRYLVVNSDDSIVFLSDRLARLNADGTRDPNFVSVPFDREGFWLVRTADGRYLVPDLTWININGIQQPVWGNGVAAFAANGQPDFSFQLGGYGRSQIPNAGRVLSTGDVWVSGGFNRFGAAYVPGLAKFSAPATLAANQASLPANATANWTSLPGSIVTSAAGDQTYVLRFGLLQRLNADGSIDTTYSPVVPTGYVFDTATPTAAGSGKLILSQSSISATAALAGSTGDAMFRLNADGSRDTGFVANLSSFATVERATPTSAPTMIRTGGLNVAQVLADGRVLVSLSAIDGTFKLQRLLANGSVDTTFTAPSFGTVTAVTGFTSANTFDPVSNTSGQWSVTTYPADDLIRAAVQMPDGKVYVGGRFSLPNVPRGLARLNADGSLDTTFTGAGIATPFSDSNAYVTALAADVNGRLYVAGRFSSYNGTAVAGIFRLAPDGSLDTAWAPGFGVYDLPTANVQLTIANGRLYAIGTVGTNATALPVPYASVALSFPPVISTQPSNVTAPDGSFTTFSVTASGAGTLTYQWFLNGNAISGATGSTLALQAVRPTDAGTYTVAVTSAGGTTVSTAATLTVNPSAPAFLARGNILGTFGYVFAAGSSATLTAAPSAGSLPITYQWRFNGVDIPGATGPVYSLTNWQPANSGGYSVAATNAQGTVVSPVENFWVTSEAGLAWANPRPTGNGTTGIIFANNRFIIGGLRGTLLTSADGVSWTAGNLTGTNNIAAFAFGNGTYVGVGTLGALYYSADGTNWEPSFNRPNLAINEVVFGLGRFVAVGADGQVGTSTDGRNWNFSIVPGLVGGGFGGLVFDEDTYYAITSTDKIFKSTNGSTWTEHGTLPTALNSLALSTAPAGGAVAVGPNGQIFSTDDGITWTARNSGTTQEWVSVRYLNNQYIAVGTLGALATSPDGITWTLRTTSTQSTLWAVDFGAGRFVVTGQGGRNIITSTDGVTWISNITGQVQGTHLLGVATNNTTTVAVGNGGTVLASSDLTTWQIRPSGIATTINLSDVVFAGGKFVAVAGNSNAVTASTDGLTWTVQTTTGLTTSGLQGITYDTATSNYVAVGNGGGIFTSPDAVAWTASSSPTTGTLRKVVAAGGRLVAVGQSGEILSATSATTAWTRVLSGAGRAIADVAFGNNTWVAVGAGVVYTSSDAATWTNTTFASVNLVAVKFIQGNFIALSNNHTYFTSTDGINWQGRSSGAFDPLLDAVAVSTANGARFVGVGNFGTILTGGVPSMPGSRTVNVVAGQRVDLNAHVSGSPVPVTYSWTKGGNAINGQTSYLYTINAAAPSDAGTYVVTASNSFGFGPSNITLVVNTPPSITTQPVATNLPENGSVLLSVAATGSGTLSYQWFKDGVALTGGTGSNLSTTQAGTYTVQVTSAFGTVTSAAAVVTLVPAAPVIATAPSIVGAFGPVFPAGTATYLQANIVQGTRPMTFQWSFNGVDIPGATGEFLYRSQWQQQHAGIYAVRASNAIGASNVTPGEQIYIPSEGGWRWRNPTPTGNGITRVAFVNNLFLLGGLRGTILTSPDGVAWTQRPIPVSNNVFAFRYVGGRYVAMASLNAIFTSTDAITWTPRNLGIDGSVSALQDMTAGSDGRLVAVGTAGVTAVSTDAGETWTVGNLGTGNTDSLTGATFTLGRFFAVSIAQGRIYSSTDGTAWTFTNVNAPWLRALAFGGGRLVAVGGTGTILTSTDGSNWAPATSGTTNDLLGVSYVNGRFIAVGALGTILTSTDGLTWTARSAAGNQSGLQNVAFGAGRYVIGGQGGNSGKVILTSTDAVNWTIAIPGPRQGTNFNAVAASSSAIVAVGNNGFILSSTDKVTWTDRASGVSTNFALNDVVYDSIDGRFVAVGSSGTVTTSADQGVTWTVQPTNTTISGVGLTGVAVSPNIGGSAGYLVVGGGGVIATTTNLGTSTTWTRRTTGTTSLLRKVIYAGGQHVVVGGGGAILTSPDAITWTIRSSGTTVQLNDVAYGAGTYVAVGTSGTALRSTDGVTWTPSSRITPAALVSVKFIDGQFIATSQGSGAAYFVSTDGANWTGRVTGAFDTLLDTEPFQGEVVGVGAFGTVLTAGAPVVEGAPATITANANTAVRLHFPTWNSAEAVTYVWTKDGNVLPNAANAPTLVLPSVTSADAGVYRVTATNSKGSTQSAPIQLALNVTIAIQQQPVSQTSIVGGSATFSVTATGTPTPTYQWLLNGNPIANATGSSVTFNNLTRADAGTVRVVITNAGGRVISDAATLTVNPLAPIITSPLAAFTVANSPFAYSIGTNQTIATFAATGLPAGLSIDPASGVISGTPTQVGTYNVAISATNVSGSDSETLVITVQPPAPGITSPASASGRVGVAFSYTITASNSPTAFFAGTLPAGLTLSGATISGTPTVAGFYSTYIAAQNATGLASQTLTIQIAVPLNAPTFTGSPNLSATAGSAFTFTPAFSGSPTSYALVNLPDGSPSVLPAGLSFSTSTGAITGTPTEAATFSIAIRATNADGSLTKVFTLTVNPAPTAPSITSASSAVATVGTPFTFNVLTSPAATSFAATGLPAGLSINTGTGAITGTPTEPGVATVALTATNGAGSRTAALTLTVNSSPLAPSITSAPAISGRVNQALSSTLTASASPTGFAIISGTLPAGLSLDGATGAITGTPTAAGQTKVWFAASNVAGGRGPAVEVLFDILRALTVPAISSNGTAAIQVGQNFLYQITATNNPTGYAASGLPAGLSLNATTGVISGIPTTEGSTDVILTATNGDGTSAPKLLTITVTPPPATPKITSATSASGRVGVALTYQLTATDTPTSYTVDQLPAGLSLDASSGAITGTPTAAGPIAVSARAANVNGLGVATTINFTIAAPLTAPAVTSAASVAGQVGVVFTYQITASNLPDSFSLTGTLPDGLSLNTSTGVISGNPGDNPGLFTVSVYAINSAGTSQPQSLLINIQPAANTPVITSATQAPAQVGAAFTYQITATNVPGTTPFPTSVSLDATGLPAGLAVNSSTGQISGTPSAAGTYTVTLWGVNENGRGASRALTINVTPAPNAPVVTSASQASAQVGTVFTYQITATNNPTSFEALDAPAWLSVNTATGVLSGTPTSPYPSTVLLRAANAGGESSAVSLTITVAAAANTPVVTSERSATGRAGQSFTYQITATLSPTSYRVAGLPRGLVFDSATGAITGTPADSGTFLMTVSAVNGQGEGQPVTVQVTISPSLSIVGG